MGGHVLTGSAPGYHVVGRARSAADTLSTSRKKNQWPRSPRAVRGVIIECSKTARNEDGKRITVWLLSLVLVLGVVAAQVSPISHASLVHGKPVLQIAFAALGLPLAFVSRYYFRVGPQRRSPERRSRVS